MRVPIPIAVLVILCLIGGIWWQGTRHTDFLTPPSEAELSALRAQVQASIPQPPEMEDAISVRKPLPPKVDPLPDKPIEPPLEMGDLKVAATLSTYVDQAGKGPGYLIELASLLENEGQFQRALLAWERVLDSTTPAEPQAKAAIAAIKRLRPTLPDWNEDAGKGITVVLNAGTGKKMAKLVKPQLDEIAKNITRFSSGILKVSNNVNVGKTSAAAANSPTPVALWFAGPKKESTSTEIASFTAATPENLRAEAHAALFSLVSGQLARMTSHPAPLPPAEGEEPDDALEFHITRLQWERFGNALNETAANP